MQVLESVFIKHINSRMRDPGQGVHVLRLAMGSEKNVLKALEKIRERVKAGISYKEYCDLVADNGQFPARLSTRWK